MHAHTGDWLILPGSLSSQHSHRAAILAVGADGEPPYTVRWVDDDREAIVFPGPDAKVITREQQAELDRQQAKRIAARSIGG